MSTDLTPADAVVVDLRPAPAPPAPRPLERAEQVWHQAVSLAGRPSRDDPSLELLRGARHDTTILAHALSLGRTRLRARPDDGAARRSIELLETAIAFLGVKPEPGELQGSGPRPGRRPVMSVRPWRPTSGRSH